jgi:hypothetical protein
MKSYWWVQTCLLCMPALKFPDLVAQDGCMHCFVSLQLGSFFNPSRCHLVGELAPEC